MGKKLQANGVAENTAHDVEASPSPIHPGAPRVTPRRTFQKPPLLAVDGTLGLAELPARPRFDLHKHQPIAVPSDEIDLTGAARGALVSRHDQHASSPHEPMRQVLGTPFASLFRRPERA